MIYDPPRRWADSWVVVPRYTASLDAAASLVPEGWGWDLRVGHAAQRARCYAWDGHGIWADRAGTYATPALALCAAALRARHAEASHDR